MVIKENSNYRLISLKPEKASKITIITFDFFEKQKDYCEPLRFADFSATNYITKLGFNNFKIQTRRNDWYQLEGALDLFEEINSRKQKGDVFITYGMSMGAAAAINFSEVIGADYFIALAPQASLNSDYMSSIMDNRWREATKFYNKDFLLTSKLLSKQGIVIVDPSNPLDYKHANTIQQYTSAQIIKFLGVGHFPGKALVQGNYTLKNILSDVAETLKSDGKNLTDVYRKIEQAIAEHEITQFFNLSAVEKIKYIVSNNLSFIHKGVLQSLIFQMDSKNIDSAIHAFICYSLASRFGEKQQKWVSFQLKRRGFKDFSKNS